MNHLSITPPDAETCRLLMDAPWVAMDTEFDGPAILSHPHKKPGKKNKRMPDELQARLVGFSLWYPGCPWPQGAYFPTPHSTVDDGKLDNATWLEGFLGEYRGQVWFHNALADLTVLCNPTNQFPFPHRVCDSMLLAWCLGKRPPGQNDGLSLDALIRCDLGVEGGKSFQESFGGRGAGEVPDEEMAPYAARDAWYTGRLIERYLAELTDEKLRRHIFNTEMPLLRCVHQMFVEGVRVDADALDAHVKDMRAQCGVIACEFESLTRTFVQVPVKVRKPTGEFFKNGKPKMKTVPELQEQCLGAAVGSDAQVRRWMYEELRWWPVESAARTDSGLPSVKSDNIAPFANLSHSLAARAAVLRLQYKKLDKLSGTYCRPLPFYANKHGDGRVHSGMHQTGTETGRFSSSGPNLQNLPRPSEAYYGKTLPNIREVIIPRKGYVLLGADYAQLELRILAHLSRDPALCAAFIEGEDPHQATRDTVKRLYGLDIDRTKAKTTIFGIMYGQGPAGLARQLGIHIGDAKKLIEGVYKAYPDVRDYQRRAVAYARKHNAIPTLGGFIRQLDYPPGGCEKDGSRQEKQKWCSCGWCKKASAEDRKAKNTPVQGSAGVLMKRAMVTLEREWRGTPCKILMQVHDELLCEIPDDAYRMPAKDDLVLAMEGAMELRVPLVAEANWGKTWAELK